MIHSKTLSITKIKNKNRELWTINSTIKNISFRLFQPYENNDISKKITDQVYKYSTQVSHDDWIPPKTFFRQWLHPLFGGWTPYFLSTLSTIYIYLYTHIHLEFLFRSKLPTILNEWPYSRRACTSLENRLTQFTVRFHGTIVNCYDSMPSLFPPSSTLIALSLSIPIYVDYPVESVFARNRGYRYRFRVGCGRCFI